MWKIALGVVLTLLGVIGAGIVTYFSQKRQFNFDRRKQGKIYKNLLETLVQEIEYIYKKLKEHGSIYSEHYDVSIQNEVINKLLDTELIFKNRDVFGKIRDLIRELLKLNGKIEEYILIVRNPSYWDKKVDAMNAKNLNEVNDYKNSILNSINFQDIIEKLENIKNSVDNK